MVIDNNCFKFGNKFEYAQKTSVLIFLLDSRHIVSIFTIYIVNCKKVYAMCTDIKLNVQWIGSKSVYVIKYRSKHGRRNRGGGAGGGGAIAPPPQYFANPKN